VADIAHALGVRVSAGRQSAKTHRFRATDVVTQTGAQIRAAFENVRTVLEASSAPLDDVIHPRYLISGQRQGDLPALTWRIASRTGTTFVCVCADYGVGLPKCDRSTLLTRTRKSVRGIPDTGTSGKRNSVEIGYTTPSRTRNRASAVWLKSSQV
jgi:hypothetical protein